MNTRREGKVIVETDEEGLPLISAGCGESVDGDSQACECVPVGGNSENRFAVFTEGDELYKSMLEAISTAQKFVDMESYIFADDEVGGWFAEALAERARSGVPVRLHIDAAGSLFWATRRLDHFLRRNGVDVRWFHRWSWRRPWRYNRRNHRKLLVVDGEYAWLGGFNIHRQNSRNIYGEKRWRDTHVMMDGALAKMAERLFDAFWHRRRGWVPPADPGDSTLVHNHTRTCRHRLRCIYATAFGEAKQRIYLTTPYFVPDSHTRHELRAAARRGIDVRLLVPRKSDVRLAQWAARAAYESLLAAGVRIYEYLPRVLHAKTVVVDGAWSMVGTANLDYRSLFVNYELNLVSFNYGLSQALEQEFFDDLDESEAVRREQWSRRGWRARVAEMLAWAIRRWL